VILLANSRRGSFGWRLGQDRGCREDESVVSRPPRRIRQQYQKCGRTNSRRSVPRRRQAAEMVASRGARGLSGAVRRSRLGDRGASGHVPYEPLP
jgi:hypothetical protein